MLGEFGELWELCLPGGSPKQLLTRGISSLGELWELWESSGQVWEVWERDSSLWAGFGSSGS